jgi:cell division protein FtsB
MIKVDQRVQFLVKKLKNKYVISLIVFFFWLLIFDQNNLIDRFKAIQEIHQLEEERAYYLDRLEEDARRLKELKTNEENLEKFAREEYFMKRDNEDIYVIIEEEE